MVHNDRDLIPTWGSSAATWEYFKTEVELRVDSDPTHDRNTCGARVARRLTGRARIAMLGMTSPDRDKLRGTDGVTFLLAYLRLTIWWRSDG